MSNCFIATYWNCTKIRCVIDRRILEAADFFSLFSFECREFGTHLNVATWHLFVMRFGRMFGILLLQGRLFTPFRFGILATVPSMKTGSTNPENIGMFWRHCQSRRRIETYEVSAGIPTGPCA
jgi:hypothetical protein